MMRIRRTVTAIITLVMLLMLVAPTLAQRGGRGGGTGIDRPPVDLSNLNLPNLPEFDMPDLPDDLAEWTIPESWDEIALPESLPTTVAELEAWLMAYDIPLELDLEAMKPASNPDAAAVVSGFASTYLGASVAPIYAGVIYTGQEVMTGDFQQIMAAMPSEIQNMMFAIAMMKLNAFWAVFNDGFGIVSSDIPCDNDMCSIDLGRAQLTIEEASVGIYALYRPIVVSDAATAQSLVISTYPALASYPLTGLESEQGFVFTATDLNPDAPVGYIVGVLTEGNQSLVFATALVGEGMMEMAASGS
ncbi:MAG: hypothetical protein H6670_01690 [Anaerolineaceae bacterium]|nr:hypothetical protein [Anaerolineaceae bacterium]